MARSHKPIVWGLFAAGGTLTAFILPVLIILSSLGAAFGILPGEILAYDSLHLIVRNPLTKLFLFGTLFLTVWHAAHRMRITAHDLGMRADTAVAVVLYGIAALSTVVLASALLAI
jgi:fumarate reductase subunit D